MPSNDEIMMEHWGYKAYEAMRPRFQNWQLKGYLSKEGIAEDEVGLVTSFCLTRWKNLGWIRQVPTDKRVWEKIMVNDTPSQ